MKRALPLLVLLAYLAIGGFGFLHSYQMTGQGHTEAAPCPFMQDQSSLCDMDGLAHFAAWQGMFSGTVPEAFFLLAVVLIAAAFFSQSKPNSEQDRRILVFKERSSEIPPLYQILFSRGILNPKAP